MAKFNKIPLLSFLACVLTIGGIFGAWVFGEEGEESQKNIETDVGVEANPNFYFGQYSITVTFDAGTANGLNGMFSDGNTSKSLVNGKFQGLNQEMYASAIGENPKLYNVDGTINEEYIFSHWEILDNQGNPTHFNFDTHLDSDTVATAKYVPIDENPVLYLCTSDEFTAKNYGEPIVGFFLNPDSEDDIEEYMHTNFLVKESYGGENRGNTHYVVVHQTKAYKCVDVLDSKDHVRPGQYKLYFRPGDSKIDVQIWQHFSGHVLFEANYKFSIVGNPNGDWWDNHVSTPFLAFESKTTTTIGLQDLDVYTYKAKRVLFYDDLGNYNFKIVDRYFDIWGHNPSGTQEIPAMEIHTSSTSYIAFDGDNMALKTDGQNERLFDVTAIVTYYENGTHNGVYYATKFPKSIVYKLQPSSSTITFYNDNQTDVISTVDVKLSTTINTSDIPDENDAEPTLNYIKHDKYEITKWINKETREEVDLSTLVIEQDLELYAVYNITQYKALVYLSTAYSLSNSTGEATWAEDLEPTVIYNETDINNLTYPAPSQPTDSTLLGWTTDITANTITTITIDNLKTQIRNGGTHQIIKLYPAVKAPAYRMGLTGKINLVRKAANDYSLSGSQIYLGTYILGNKFSGTATNLTLSSGKYQISFDNNYNGTIKRKIGFAMKTGFYWYEQRFDKGYAIYCFNSSSNAWYTLTYIADGNDSNGVAFNLRYAYVGVEYTAVIFVMLKSTSSSLSWNNKECQSNDIYLNTGYTSTNFVYYHANDTYSTYYNSWSGSWGSLSGTLAGKL